jgi:hypothetical protein
MVHILARGRCTESAKIGVIDARRGCFEIITWIEALYLASARTSDTKASHLLAVEEIGGGCRVEYVFDKRRWLLDTNRPPIYCPVWRSWWKISRSCPGVFYHIFFRVLAMPSIFNYGFRTVLNDRDLLDRMRLPSYCTLAILVMRCPLLLIIPQLGMYACHEFLVFPSQLCPQTLAFASGAFFISQPYGLGS